MITVFAVYTPSSLRQTLRHFDYVTIAEFGGLHASVYEAVLAVLRLNAERHRDLY